MGGFVVDGLASGLDTTSMIRQLLEVEKAPQKQLEARKSSLEATIKVFNQLNTKFKAVRDAADALTGPADWERYKATSSDEAVATATVTGSPSAGSISFEVTSLAKAHVAISSTAVADTDTTTVATAGTFELNGTAITLAADATLTDLATAINDSDAPVSATVVKVADGDHRLQLTAQSTGTANAVTITDTGGVLAGLGTIDTVTAAADAQIQVGDAGAPGAYTITSSTNTFADVMPGLSFTAVAEGTATISVGRDAEGLADAVEKVVEAMNEVQTFIADNSKYDDQTKKAGVFLGESLPSRLFTQMQNQVIDPVAGSALYSHDVGIETDRYGKISFDRAAFLDAYAEDPAAVESYFGKNVVGDTADDGLAERLSRMAEDATRLNTGAISSHIAGQERTVEMYEEQIERWDLRLEMRETSLRRQFSAMETALGRMQQQGQWLASQLAGLPQTQ